MKKIGRIIILILMMILFMLIEIDDVQAGDTYTITSGTSYLKNGIKFNNLIRTLVPGKSSILLGPQGSAGVDTYITDIQWTTTDASSGVEKHNIADQGEPVYAYLDGTVVKLYTTSNTVYFNEDSSFMFSELTALTNISILSSKISTIYCTDMNSMFSYSTALTTINLSNFDTRNVTNMHDMFSGIDTSLHFTLWNADRTSIVEERNVLYNKSPMSITTLDFSSFNTSKVTDIHSMFAHCEQLEELNLSNFDMTNVKDSSYMFHVCKKLKNINTTGWKLPNVLNTYAMFNRCYNLTSVDVSQFDLSKCTNADFMFNMNTYSAQDEADGYKDWINTTLTELDVSNWNVSNIRSMDCMFCGIGGVETFNTSNWVLKPNKCPNTFSMMKAVKNFDVSKFDMSNCSSIRLMFSDCNNATFLGLSNWDTSNITDMYGLFGECNNIDNTTIAQIKDWNTSNNTSLANTFRNCNKITQLTLNWDTSKVETYKFCFYNCYNLSNVDLHTWNLDGRTTTDSLYGMFDSVNNYFKIITIKTPKFTHKEGVDNDFYISPKYINFSIDDDFNNIPDDPTFGLNRNGYYVHFDVNNTNGGVNESHNYVVVIKCTYEANGGKFSDNSTSKVLYTAVTASKFYTPTENPTVTDGSVFVNWYTEPIDGDSINNITFSASTYVNKTNIFYAHYGTESVLLDGKNFNIAIKQLVNPTVTNQTSADSTITSIEWTDVAPADGVTTKKVSKSGVDIIAYLDGTVVKLYTATPAMAYLNSDTYYMFGNLTALISIPMLESNITSPNDIITCQCMFTRCTKLTTLDLSNLKITNKCIYLHLMFQHCENLETITCDFTTWDISNVIKFNGMFAYCYKLTSLDLSTWQVTNKCTDLGFMFDRCENLETLNCDFTTWDVSNVTDFSAIFQNCQKLTTLNLSNWQVTNKCTYLRAMFNNCKNLETLTCDFTTWDVSNNTDFCYMFSYCEKLASLDLTNWQVTNKCTNLCGMFRYCENLDVLNCNFTTWDVSNVTTFAYMFYCCEKLTTLDLSNWHVTNKCTDLSYMFGGCNTLESLICDFTTWDVSNITSFASMFDSCYKLTSLNLTGWQVTNKCTNLRVMLAGCTNLEILTCDFNTWDVSNVTDFGKMFRNCKKLTSLDISNWQVANKCTNLTDIFYGCDNLEKIKMFNTYNISSEDMLKNLFSYDMVLDNNEDSIGDDNVARKDAIKDINTTDKQIYIKYVVPTYSILTTGKNFNAKVKSLVSSSATSDTYDTTITSIEWTNIAPANGVTTKKVSESGADVVGYLDGTVIKLYTTVDTVYLNENSSYMFYYFQALESLPIAESKLDTSNVTNFSFMFDYCENLTSLNLSNWNTSNGTNFSSMFGNCYKISSIGDISDWDVSNCTDFIDMFADCSSLTTLDLSNWNVSNGTKFSGMFFGCRNLTSIGDLSNWSVSKVTNFFDTFSGCWELTSLGDISNWDVSNCTNFSSMFSSCYKLTSLNLYNWNVSNCTNFNYMFSGCTSLTELNLSNWNMSNAVSITNMFYYCSSLSTIEGLNNWNISSVQYAVGVFGSCYELTSLDLSGWNTENVLTMREIFANCYKLTEIKGLSGFNLSSCITTNKIGPNTNSFERKAGTKDMFLDCYELTTLELFDTSLISDDIPMPNLPMTMKLDDDQNKIADTNTDYTSAIRDTTSGTKHTYIKATNSILLDYNGGTLNDETTHRIYYLSDGSLVTVNSLDEYLPTKDGNIANGWTRNNVDVTFPLNISGIQNATLTAKYPVTYHVFVHSNDIYDENGYPVGDSKVIDITCTAEEDISVALKNAYISATNVPLTGHNQLTAHGLIAVYGIPNNKYVVSGIDEEPVERRLYIPTIPESTSSITHIIPNDTINATGVLYNFSETDGTRVDLYVLWNWDDIQRDHVGNSYADIYTRNNESDPFYYVHVVIVNDRYSNKQNLVKCNWH